MLGFHPFCQHYVPLHRLVRARMESIAATTGNDAWERVKQRWPAYKGILDRRVNTQPWFRIIKMLPGLETVRLPSYSP